MITCDKHTLSDLRIDWELLHQQKLALVELLDTGETDDPLWGLVELLDALEDSAETNGLISGNDGETN